MKFRAHIDRYSRRDFLKTLSAGMALSLVSKQAWPSSATPNKPNIVILLADDLGWRDVGYHGAEFDTPHIDGLVRKGIELDRFYACPVCSPTRAGLMTGRYPIRYGGQRATYKAWGTRALPVEEQTLAEMLEEAGYEHRGVFGKWHLGRHARKHHPLQQGFTDFLGHYGGAIDYFSHERLGALDWHRNYALCHEAGYSTNLIGKAAVEFIRKCDGVSPFFLYVAFNAIHTPNHVLEAYMKRNRHIEDEPRRQKAAMVTCMDDVIGSILRTLDEKGARDNTLVLFFSDNGGAASGSSNAPLRGRKHTVWEGGIRVDAAVHWPGVLEGPRKLEVPISYLDVFPTLQAIAGVRRTSYPLDGMNVFDILRGKRNSRPWEFHSYFEGKNIPGNKKRQVKHELNALNTTDWKLVRQGPNVLQVEDLRRDATISLFRIREDPFEKNDLASEYPELVNQMLDKIKAFRQLQPKDLEPVSLYEPKGWKPPENWEIARE